MPAKKKKSLKDLKGLGPASIKKLSEADVATLGDLVKSDTRKLSKESGIAGKKISVWKREAKKITAEAEHHHTRKKTHAVKHHAPGKKTKSVTIQSQTLLAGLAGLILLSSVWGLILLSDVSKNIDASAPFFNTIPALSSRLDKKIADVIEMSIPAKISIITITDSSCGDCSTVTDLLESIKKDHVNVTSEETIEYDSGVAKGLIGRYNINVVPTVIVSSSEFNKTGLKKKWENIGTVESDGSLVLRTLNPPYRKLDEHRILGRVKLTLITDSSCADCTDISGFKNQLTQSGVSIASEETLEFSKSSELVAKYNIKKIPAIILSRDISAYDNIKESWSQYGSIAEDGSYVHQSVTPPYIDASTKKTVGLVSIVYLVDASCTDCYNVVNVNTPILRRFGLRISDEVTYDIASAEGKKLVGKYNITKVPTYILYGDPGVYSNLASVWRQVGTVGDDGEYVFKNLDVLRVKYTNITA